MALSKPHTIGLKHKIPKSPKEMMKKFTRNLINEPQMEAKKKKNVHTKEVHEELLLSPYLTI